LYAAQAPPRAPPGHRLAYAGRAQRRRKRRAASRVIALRAAAKKVNFCARNGSRLMRMPTFRFRRQRFALPPATFLCAASRLAARIDENIKETSRKPVSLCAPGQMTGHLARDTRRGW